ncbi:hypothetical protein ACJIZ3_000819 [Penstemon smallii]|uniref:Protein IQ-DOMAIN 1 n=1 Tax=Penstemon smallii TaxID=265156 RepID=A0ABD3U3C5_9LAMI
MGRKGSWFSSVKKALSPSSKEKKSKNSDKSKKNEKPSVSESTDHETIDVSNPHPLPLLESVKFTQVQNDRTELACSVAPPASAVVPPTKVPRFAGKSNEEVAAIKIQTAFRGYLARRALRALRGLVRLKSLVDGPTVKRQSANTLKCMQTLSRVHSQVQSRRIRMSEENRALQKQLLQNRTKELESLRMGEDWDDSLQSKEKIEANLLHKFEAAMRRERALAYSYTHQQTWKKSAKSNNLLFMDPTNPQWGWSWLERWEAQTTTSEKDLKSASSPSTTAVGEITKSFTRHQLNSDDTSFSPTSQKQPPSARKSKQTFPKVMSQDDDDSRSLFSSQSERNRRHTIGGSSVRDDESLTGSPTGPSYMAATKSAKAKSRLPSPLGPMENGNNTLEKGSTKKRLSFAPSPARPIRRHSEPPKAETGSIGGNGVLIN